MARRIFKQRTVFSIILISVFALSLISTYAPAVLGTWTSDGSFTEFNGLLSPGDAVDQYVNQSVAVSAVDQSIHIAFLSDGLYEDMILYQSSKDMNFVDYEVTSDYKQLSNTSGNPVLSAVAHPDIAVGFDGNASVVFEGVSGGTRYIYYTNNSVNNNFTTYIQVDSFASTDQTNPSIVCTPDGTIHVFYTESTNVYYVRSNNGGRTFVDVTLVASSCDYADAVILTAASGDDCVYVVCIDDSSFQINLSNATESDWLNWGANLYTYVSAAGDAVSRPKIDTTGEFFAVTWAITSGTIRMFNCTGMYRFGTVTQVTTTSFSDPSVVVDRHGGVSVLYSRNMYLDAYSHQHQGIFMRSSRESSSYSIEDNVATDQTYMTPSEATVKRNPVVARYNDTIIVVYQRADYMGGNPQSLKLYINGFVNFYEDSPTEYARIMVGEDPAGVFLFESLYLSYNSSVAYDVNITIVDNATGISWTNITKLPAGGGYEQKIVFYNMTEMFLSDSFYWITISNASVASGPKLAKFWVDFTRKADYDEGDPHHYYVTEETGSNGTLSQFKVGIEWRGYLDRLDLPEGRENQLTGTFSSTNHVDLYEIELDNSYLYNLTISEASPTDKVEVRFYNNSVRLANVSSALFTLDTSLGGSTSKSFKVNHTQVGTVPYYVMVLRQNNSHSFNYNIFYEQAPHLPIIIRPIDKQFFNVTTVDIRWNCSGFDRGLVDHYDLQIDTVNTFDSGSLQSIMRLGELNSNYTFTTGVSGWFYWRVSVTDINQNQGPWSTTSSFAVDITAPAPPEATELDLFQKTGSFKVNWTVPSDAPFSVKYYNVYMSTKPGVALTSQNLVTVPNTLKTNQYYTNSLPPGYYYFKITATDNAGWESTASNEVHTVVVFGEYFNSTAETFYVQAGDTLEYEIINVISPTETGLGIPEFTFGYGGWATQFMAGDRFHFWIKEVDHLSVTPVVGDFYSKSASLATYRLLTVEYPLVPFVASSNPAFMRNVSEAFMAAFMPDQAGYTKVLSQVNFTGTYQYGLDILDTFCFTYMGSYISSEDGSTSAVRASFAYDLSTGVLVELTTFSDMNGVGYTLKLVDGTPDFIPSWKSWAPIIFLASVMILAGIINIVIRRIEYR